MSRTEFDPQILAKLEQASWKAHHKHDLREMVESFATQHSQLYNLTRSQAVESLIHLAVAVMNHDLRDWAKAESALIGYYQTIKNYSGLEYDATVLANIDVNLWQLHDDLGDNPDKRQLAQAFSLLLATQFGKTPAEMELAGNLRAAATVEHDLAENPHASPEQAQIHWDNTAELLEKFYTELQIVLAGAG